MCSFGVRWPSGVSCTVCENASFANELFHDHMLKHWHFPFPALQSFAMMWRINHCMKSLMVRRLVNCTKLHSIKLGLWKNESAMQYQMMNIKNRPEVIRKIRGRYWMNGFDASYHNKFVYLLLSVIQVDTVLNFTVPITSFSSSFLFYCYCCSSNSKLLVIIITVLIIFWNFVF